MANAWEVRWQGAILHSLEAGKPADCGRGSHLMLGTRFLIRDRVVTGRLMLATGFLIRDRVLTEGETSTQAWKA